MNIFIPTYGRATAQHTLKHLPKSLQKKTTLVLQHEDYKVNDTIYNDYPCAILVLPKKIKTISPTRQFIMDHAKEQGLKKVVMLDDDLRFDIRRMDDGGKFLVATENQIEWLFKKIEAKLDKFVHVGVLAREGGNRVEEEERQCTRMMRVLAYDVKTFHEEKIKFDRLPLQEDFDVTLQLLRKGYPNLVLCRWVQGQGTSNAKGGCSTFRTIDMHNGNVEKLAKLHAPFVNVVEKQTKGAWDGMPRKDVMVQWKKAYESSRTR